MWTRVGADEYAPRRAAEDVPQVQVGQLEQALQGTGRMRVLTPWKGTDTMYPDTGTPYEEVLFNESACAG